MHVSLGELVGRQRNCGLNLVTIYRKNSKSKPWGLYFSKALFEGLIFGGAYLRRKICISKSLGLALQLEVNLPFLLCFYIVLCI